MSTDSSTIPVTRVNYGIDAPGVVKTMAMIAVALFVAGVALSLSRICWPRDSASR